MVMTMKYHETSRAYSSHCCDEINHPTSTHGHPYSIHSPPKLRSSLPPTQVPWTPDARMVCYILSTESLTFPAIFLRIFRENVHLQAKTQSQ